MLISAEKASELCRQGALLIDIRDPDEIALGAPLNTRCIPMQQLLDDVAGQLPDSAQTMLVLCASGKRSARVVEVLRAQGYAESFSVEGGFERWRSCGLAEQGDADQRDYLQRYSRHLKLPEFGVEGQQRLDRATVVLIGAGGLGSPAAFYLAAAGVGRIRLIDDDVVDRSNLQRQILHTEAAIGQAKVDSARARLSALNPRVKVETISERLNAENVSRHLAGADVVIDGADNFSTRYLLSDACVHFQLPLVYGAVERFGGQVSVFDAGRNRGESPCYRCLFPLPPGPDEAPNCAEAGVLGVLPGIIGLLQATEAIKLISGLGQGLGGRLLQFDALSMQFRELRVSPDPQCAVCRPDAQFSGFSEMGQVCATSDRGMS